MSDSPFAQQPDVDHYLVSASGLLGDPPQSKPAEVARILNKAADEKPENGLVIHFHGGLVKRTYALDDIVVPLTQKYATAGAYPLFFVWESGLLETLLNNKGEILLTDPAFRELVKKVSEFVVKKVSLTGALSFKGTGGQPIDDIHEFRKEFDNWFDGSPGTTSPPVEASEVATDNQATRGAAVDETRLEDEIRIGLDNDPDFKRALQEAFNASMPAGEVTATKSKGTAKRAEMLLLSPDALDEMFPPEATGAAGRDTQTKTRGVLTWVSVVKFVAKVVMNVIKRYKIGRDHGPYCTVVEEVLRSAYGNLLGAAIWNQMKNDTFDSFRDDKDERCGWSVMKELKKLEDAGKGFTKITLVGHSTGAIYICNFLDSAAKLGLKTPIKSIYLAPAVTCERFAQAIDAHASGGLKDFRMFAMTDPRECEDKMLGRVYTRSLLYFVAGLLEGNAIEKGWSSVIDMPLVGMQRFYEQATFSDDQSVRTVLTFLKEKPDRMVWSPASGGAGLSSDSKKHGDFDNDPGTLDSIVEFIKS